MYKDVPMEHYSNVNNELIDYRVNLGDVHVQNPSPRISWASFTNFGVNPSLLDCYTATSAYADLGGLWYLQRELVSCQ